MKEFYTAVVLCWVTTFICIVGYSQTTYTISSNTSWNPTIGGNCSNCIFNISAGVTLNMNKAITCSTCTFNGGNIVVTQDVICQPCAFSGNLITVTNKMIKPNSSISSFTNVNLTANGTATILANTAVNMTNSTFTFNGDANFTNNSSTLTMISSAMYFTADGFFLANSGPINLSSTSRLVAGDGSISSTAFIKMNGPTVNLYDNSSISIKNNNNYYFNWNAYNSPTNGMSYVTKTNSISCGGASPQHACSAPNLYGCASLNSSGAAACTILAATMDDFSLLAVNNHAEISWKMQGNVPLDHFIVERSSGNNQWTSIAVITSKNLPGENAYSYLDQSLAGGMYYFRIQLVGEDGRSSYSKVLSLDMGSVVGQVKIYPNPITNLSFTLQLDQTGPVVLNVLGQEGRMIYHTSLNGQTHYLVKLPESANAYGYLIIQAISNGKTHTFTAINKKY